jgi:ribose/xylose/arabinose/galactoside ABC-type transport system permease subunit
VDRQAQGLERLSGHGLHVVGLEFDAIAAVVIGGILLTGALPFVFCLLQRLFTARAAKARV